MDTRPCEWQERQSPGLKDLFAHWMRFASTSSMRVGLETAALMRAHDVVCSTMGWRWLEDQRRTPSGRTRSIADSHPLYIALNGKTDGCVAEVLRVAAYLFAFRDDPQLRQAIATLRDAGKYDATLFELDLAWKFRNAGADVRLFPRTPNGSGDFSASIRGKEYIVESSGFRSDTLRDDAMSLLNAIAASFVAATRKSGISKPFSLELDVEDASLTSRSSAHAAVKEIVQALYRDRAASHIVRVFDCGSIAVRSTLPGEGPTGDDMWTCAVRIGKAPIAKSRILGATSYAIEGAGCWVYLRDRSAESDPHERIRGKLKNEARQLSGCTDGVIVLDIEALGADVINDRDGLLPVIEDFRRNHHSTTGVALAVQPEKLNGQPGLWGHYFSLSETAMPQSFWSRVIDLDESADLLTTLRAL